jgi:hypothetical protein
MEIALRLEGQEEPMADRGVEELYLIPLIALQQGDIT